MKKTICTILSVLVVIPPTEIYAPSDICFVRHDLKSPTVIASKQERKGQKQNQTFTNIKKYIMSKNVSESVAAKYTKYILDSSKRHGINPYWVTAIIAVETGRTFNPRLVSKHGAVGLMQILRTHAKWMGVKVRDLYNPKTNIELGTKYLSYLINKYGKRLGTIAYNQGEGRVLKGNYRTWYYDEVMKAYEEIKGH